MTRTSHFWFLLPSVLLEAIQWITAKKTPTSAEEEIL